MNNLIRGHVSPETAYTVDDYPYGRHRTQCRWWLETATKGSHKGQTRVMQQTLDPKRNVWNKPHASTYAETMVLYIEDGTGHCKNWGIGFYAKDLVAFVQSGLYFQCNADELACLEGWIKYGRRLDRTSWGRFGWLVDKARAGLTVAQIMEAAKTERTEDHYLYESDAQQALALVEAERAAGKQVNTCRPALTA